MSNPWAKFFWADWANDPALRLCSLASQGLWMRMLCVAAESSPTGYVTINGRNLGVTDIARLAGVTETEASALIDELDRNGVFSRTRTGAIYSRRMVRDSKRIATLQKNGKKGGNPSLCKDREKLGLVNHMDKGQDKPHKPIPEARKEKEIDFQSISKKKADEAPPGDDPPRQAFPAEGSIHYTPFAAMIRAVRPAVDPDVVAAAFRRYAVGADPPIRFDDPKIGKRLVGFARAHRMGGLN